MYQLRLYSSRTWSTPFFCEVWRSFFPTPNQQNHSRSVELDEWNEKQVLSMRMGGNKRLREYLTANNANHLDLKEKYSSACVEDYRRTLAEEVAKKLGYIEEQQRK